jgi:heme exporter protein B
MLQFYYFAVIHVWNSFKTQALKIYIFFCILFILFPLLFSPLPELFLNFYASIFWFSILITNFLSLEFLFKAEFEMSFFDFLLRQKISIESYIIFKILIYWVLNIFPVFLICLGGLILYTEISFYLLLKLIILLILQSLSLTFLNAIGSIFLLNNNQNYLLIFLILVPLVIPLLIFGINLLSSLTVSIFYCIIICANFCFIFFLIPWVISYLIKININ